MLWLIGIASVWMFVCVAAVSLCVMARRGDEALFAAVPPAPEPDPGFVTTFAQPVADGAQPRAQEIMSARCEPSRSSSLPL